jgi:hypothetical protein
MRRSASKPPCFRRPFRSSTLAEVATTSCRPKHRGHGVGLSLLLDHGGLQRSRRSPMLHVTEGARALLVRLRE